MYKCDRQTDRQTDESVHTAHTVLGTYFARCYAACGACRSNAATRDALAMAWVVPSAVGHWLLGRWTNDTTDGATNCTIVVDEFNFLSKFTDETRVVELGTRV